MSKIGFWKNIFRYTEKVPVDVGDKTELLTHTQSFRFNQIAENRDASPHAACLNPLEKELYSLDDAAVRLMTSVDDVLTRGAAGNLGLYVDATGQSGHWVLQHEDGTLGQSTVTTIRSGVLRLGARACNELSRRGRTVVRTLKLCNINGLSRAGLDDVTVKNLLDWGPGDKQFYPLHPLNIERDMLILLPPLEQAGGRQ